MDNNLYCSLIHKGLNLDLRYSPPLAQHCCLRNAPFPVDVTQNFWTNKNFIDLREINQKNIWASGCENCKYLELSGAESFRTGMNSGLGTGEYNTSGPERIDLMFDISCNLACAICGPQVSSTWQKHLKDNNLWYQAISLPRSHHDAVTALKQLDLSNLKMLVFAGGETLLGQAHWKVCEWLADNVPNAKQQLTVCFQTNGTQPIDNRNYELINKFHLVKLHISLDAVGDRFNYLRWPGDWSQVTDNIMRIRETAPSNTVFLIEETFSIFNLYYQNELTSWVKNNFATNREGDVVNHTQHLVGHEYLDVNNITQEYFDALQRTSMIHVISPDWKENPDLIKTAVEQTDKFDQMRKLNWKKTFPEVAEFYSRYI